MRFFGAASCLFVASIVAAAPSTPPARDAHLRSFLRKSTARGYPGVAMLIEEPNGEIRAEAVGYSDLEHHTPLRVDDAFHIASITKTFTAAATLRLVDEGKLSLDSKLAQLLGDAVAHIPHSSEITVAQLLDHSSGIYPTNNDKDYVSTLLGPKTDPTRVWSCAEMLALADKDRQKPAGEPGSGHYYSDTNYIALGMIVERIAGEPLKRYVARTFFQPLGMTSTYYYSDRLPRNGKPQPGAIQGYLLATKDLRSFISIHPMFNTVEKRKEGELLNTTLAAERIDAAAGIVSTLPDLAKFASALFRGKLLSPASQEFLMAAAHGMAAEPAGKKRTWALQSVRTAAGVVVSKEGDGPGGVNTLMAYSPAKDEIFIGFTNIFGNFNEVDFMIDDVIVPIVGGK